jgi:hypothetical protein
MHSTTFTLQREARNSRKIPMHQIAILKKRNAWRLYFRPCLNYQTDFAHEPESILTLARDMCHENRDRYLNFEQVPRKKFQVLTNSVDPEKLAQQLAVRAEKNRASVQAIYGVKAWCSDRTSITLTEMF